MIRRKPDIHAETGARVVTDDHLDEVDGAVPLPAGGDGARGRERDDADQEIDGHGLGRDGVEVCGCGHGAEVRGYRVGEAGEEREVGGVFVGGAFVREGGC